MKEDYGNIYIKKSLLFQKTFFPIPSAIAQKLFYYVVGVGHFNCQPDFYLCRHDYNNILIKYTVAGKGQLKYRGKTYTMQPNQLMIIKCFDMHEYYTYKSDNWENKWVHLCGGACYDFFSYIYKIAGPVITMSEDCTIPQKIDELISLIENADHNFESNASLILTSILTEIFNKVQNETPRSVYKQDSSISSAIFYIENNYQYPITLEDMASSSNYSLSHFIRAFKNTTSLSPHQYLQQYRVNQSKSLLASTYMSIAEISECVGFTNVNTYIRNFQNTFGVSPTEYRLKIKNGGNFDETNKPLALFT